MYVFYLASVQCVQTRFRYSYRAITSLTTTTTTTTTTAAAGNIVVVGISIIVIVDYKNARIGLVATIL